MSEPPLLTKLYIPPPRLNVVSRPRLIEQLNAGIQNKLILISAPAGFGKTTLLSDWIVGCDRPVAWISLDEGDNDPTRFLTYLVAALQTLALSKIEGIDLKIGEGIFAALESPQPPPAEVLLTDLLNEITTVPNNFILVLDDYHVIDSKPVDEALTFLLKHLPLQMHLVISTREDPHLPLARLRARGQLTELRIADLRFTPAEASEFLNKVMDLNLSVDDISDLEIRTEGWIAGLQLAAISMQGNQEPANFIKTFTGSHHYVLDYLLEEVLHQQSEDVQSFLLQTSILDRLCGSLCEAVLLDTAGSGQETLEYLEHANLFIIPLDNERRWYRYHHLFRDLLRQRLGKPKEFAEFHIRASRWYKENDDLGAAFEHAVSACDYFLAAGLAETAWQGMDDSFQTAAFLKWVKKLPEEVICVRPVLSAQIGLSFMDAGDPKASESWLQKAERLLNGSIDGMVAEDKTQLEPLPAMIALARAYNAQVQGNLSDAVKYAELALNLTSEDDFLRRAQAIITLESTQWARGNLESARSALEDWMNSMRKVGNFTFVVASAFAVSDMLVDLGRLSEAERVYQEALTLAAQQGPEAEHITAHHHLGLSIIYRQRGEDTLAAHHLTLAGEMGRQTTLVDWQYRWHVVRAQLLEAEGDLETALTLLEEAKRAYVQSPVPDLRPIEAQKACIHLKQGRLDAARKWALESGLSLIDEVSYMHEFEHLTLARLEIANPLVNTLLARLLIAAETQKRQGNAVEILLVQALAHQVQDNRAQALASLETALVLAEPEGYLRIFVDEGEPMRSLISDFRLQISIQSGGHGHPLSGYVNRLLTAYTEPEAIGQPTNVSRNSEMIEPLSQRELEVLRLIALGLSNREIGERLFLALSTVKGHARLIFDKLQVQNRTEAVVHARELGLL